MVVLENDATRKKKDNNNLINDSTSNNTFKKLYMTESDGWAQTSYEVEEQVSSGFFMVKRRTDSHVQIETILIVNK